MKLISSRLHPGEIWAEDLSELKNEPRPQQPRQNHQEKDTSVMGTGLKLLFSRQALIAYQRPTAPAMARLVGDNGRPERPIIRPPLGHDSAAPSSSREDEESRHRLGQGEDRWPIKEGFVM